jgi:uncharacterized membrane protein
MIKFVWDKRIGPVLLFKIRNKNFGVCMCHRMEERSIPFFGLEKYFCSRCIGILNGFIIGVFIKFIGLNIPLTMDLIMILPLLIDGFSQFMGYRKSSNTLRLITGFLFGIGLFFGCINVINTLGV